MFMPSGVAAAAGGADQSEDYVLNAGTNGGPSFEVGWSTNSNLGIFGNLAPGTFLHDVVSLQAIYTVTSDFKIQMSGIIDNTDQTWSRILVNGPGGGNIDSLDLLRSDADTFGSIAGGRFEWSFLNIPPTNFLDGVQYDIKIFWKS